MQAVRQRRSNRERSGTTQAALVAAARRLFLEKPYAEVSTPEVAAAAGMTRGALYHHFPDKEALFRAVVEAESAAVAAEIERTAPLSRSPVAALVRGGEEFLAAMREPGRVRLLLLDGPAVLGRASMDEIDMRHGGRTLREGLQEAMAAGKLRKLHLDAAAALLSAAYDRAALAIDAGADPRDYKRALADLIEGLSADGKRP